MTSTHKHAGFTLVELAIVLVIIGLIVGGVLVGQDLIKAAAVRAGVSQLERYDSAANTFRNKFNALPGDLINPGGFLSAITTVAGTRDGLGDGDGSVEDISASSTPCTGEVCLAGEAMVFWTELNVAGLISDAVTGNTTFTNFTPTPSDATLPASKLAKGARIAVAARNGRNYYVIGNPGTTASAGLADVTWTAGLATIDAYNIDVKMDDGVPSTGKAISIDAAAPVPITVAGGVATATPITSAACYDDTLNAYNISTGATGGPDKVNCNLGIRTSF